MFRSIARHRPSSPTLARWCDHAPKARLRVFYRFPEETALVVGKEKVTFNAGEHLQIHESRRFLADCLERHLNKYGHPRATRTIAKDFLDNLTKAVPYKIHPVLTDNGIQFTNQAPQNPQRRDAL